MELNVIEVYLAIKMLWFQTEDSSQIENEYKNGESISKENVIKQKTQLIPFSALKKVRKQKVFASSKLLNM